MKKIKTLLIEDSGIMRIMISDALRSDPVIEVVGMANDGKEGCQKVCDLRPDVVVTDMIMPHYDGLYAVKSIMEKMPTPIILLSSLGKVAPEVFDALSAGALDFIDKPQTNDAGEFKDSLSPLREKIKLASGMNLDSSSKSPGKTNHHHHRFSDVLEYEILAIGASTGGPSAIESILSQLPENLAIPVIIVQHMPERFLVSYAERLTNIGPIPVKVAERNEEPRPGTVYILPGDGNMSIQASVNGTPSFQYVRKTYRDYDSPSINCMFESIAAYYGDKAIGAILTGMGKDGCTGLLEIKKKGGLTIAQDAASCVIYGMPKVAVDMGAADHVVDIDDMPGFIMSCF